MAWTTFAGIYIVLWWVVLFAVLPFGVHSQEESGGVVPGTDPGAPAVPNLRAKLRWTTIISAGIFFLFCGVYASNLINIDKFGTLWGLAPR